MADQGEDQAKQDGPRHGMAPVVPIGAEGMVGAVPADADPDVERGPVGPLIVMTGTATAVDGAPLVVMCFRHPMGENVFFLKPEAAAGVGARLKEIGEAAASQLLAVEHRIVTPDGDGSPPASGWPR